MSAVRIWKPENPENLVLYLDVMSLGTNARQVRSGGVSDGSRLAIYIDARVPFFVLRARASCMRQAFVQSIWVPCASLHPTWQLLIVIYCYLIIFIYSCRFCLVLVAMLRLELCKCSSDIFQFSRPRTGLTTA